jgi:hypothetical protein
VCSVFREVLDQRVARCHFHLCVPSRASSNLWSAHSPVHMQAGRRCGARCCLLRLGDLARLGLARWKSALFVFCFKSRYGLQALAAERATPQPQPTARRTARRDWRLAQTDSRCLACSPVAHYAPYTLRGRTSPPPVHARVPCIPFLWRRF